jgi:CheY-like chemotaxis protein
MSDDFISMKMLIVSEAAPERELLRRAAAEASIPVDFGVRRARRSVAMGELLARQNFDVVFFDSRIAKPARQEFLNVIRAAPSRPLAVLIAPAMLKTREVFTDGLEVDSALAKPIDPQETRDLIACCIRARLPQRVLVVDDSSTVRSVVRKVLQASRCKLAAEEAADGGGDRACQKAALDIVFLTADARHRRFATLNVLRRASGHEGGDDDRTRDHRIEDRARERSAKFLFKPFFARTSTPC